jgi:hypothetical protein
MSASVKQMIMQQEGEVDGFATQSNGGYHRIRIIG